MGNKSRVGQQIQEEIVLKNAKGKGLMDVGKALKLIIKRMTSGNGYYLWIFLAAQGTDCPWVVRIPRNDLADEDWMKNEAAEVIHVCHPSQFLDAYDNDRKQELSTHCGYVRDSACTVCKKDMPEEYRKRSDIQIKLHQIGLKVV